MIKPLSEVDSRGGAKAANLARLLREGLHVPAGLVIEDALDDRRWHAELAAALHDLGSGPYAVRSSAVGEDGHEWSFAGQLHTTLDVNTVAEVERAVLRTAASGTKARAAAYAHRTGHAVPTSVPVIVQVMVRSEVAGVMFTRHPVTGADQVVVEAHRGLADQVVDGRVTPQLWTVADRAVAGPRTADHPVLTAPQVRALAEIGRRIEALFGQPQDVEWAIADGTVWVLQARPITTASVTAARASRGAGKVLLTGTPAGGGVAQGPVRIVRDLDGFAGFQAGDILVCRTTSPAWTPLLACAAAVVTEIGGILAHAAIVAREFGIPAVTGAVRATSMLTDGSQVAVDGFTGTVASPIVSDHRCADRPTKENP